MNLSVLNESSWLEDWEPLNFQENLIREDILNSVSTLSPDEGAKVVYEKLKPQALAKFIQSNKISDDFFHWFIKEESNKPKYQNDYYLLLEAQNLPRFFIDFCIEATDRTSREFLEYVLFKNPTTPPDLLEELTFSLKEDKNFVRNFELVFNNPNALKETRLMALGKLIRFYKNLQHTIRLTRPLQFEVNSQVAYDQNKEFLKSLRTIIKNSSKKLSKAEFTLVKLLY